MSYVSVAIVHLVAFVSSYLSEINDEKTCSAAAKLLGQLKEIAMQTVNRDNIDKAAELMQKIQDMFAPLIFVPFLRPIVLPILVAVASTRCFLIAVNKSADVAVSIFSKL